ncbi:YafY family transcriptional regulator [Lutibacter sp. B2]|nr:YafY family transcriptional regulator [Lutibacter sp. B2]
MQIDRLFQIVYILLDKKHVTAKELSEIFEVSTRTIYRDVDTLSMAGIPIYTNKGKGGGISIFDNFVMNKSVLSKKEQNNLLLGLETIKATEYEEVDKTLFKLKSLFNRSDDHWIEVDFSHWGGSKNDKSKFEELKLALTTARTIHFDYYDSYGTKTTRMVHPLKLVFKEKAWYLKAYCLLKKDYRIFKIHRINNLQITDNIFDRAQYNLAQTDLSYKNTSNKITLKITLSSKAIHRVYDEFNINSIIKNEDGSFSITFLTFEDEWLYNYIISFGKHIKIIEPIYINTIIKDRLENILENYN